MRRVALVIAVGWHLFVAAVLVWLMYQQFLATAHPPRKGQEEVVQVEFIGQGTPEETGGGSDAAPTPAPQEAAAAVTTEAEPEPAASQAAATQPEPVESPPAVATTSPPDESEPEPEPVDQPPPRMVDQAIQVSEPTPDADTDYKLPPPMPRLQAPQINVPDRPLTVPETSVVELPRRQEPTLPTIAPRPVPEAAIEQTVPDVVVREVAQPLPMAPTITMSRPTVSVPTQPLKTQALREREIPAPPATALATQSEQPVATEAETASSEAPSAQASARTAASDESDQAASAQSAGPKTEAAPGGWSSPKRSDDWGESTREVAGAEKGDPSGLYNSDGSVRLAETPGSASPGQPPGEITDEIVNLDRGGTWLKRAPTDYEPTAFDRYWRPGESLLEEWVRKSITTVRIPIPGTTKHVVCKTILLMAGGACDITDPNLQDVPATARPAPDVPFKPSLQEDNGSLPDPVEE